MDAFVGEIRIFGFNFPVQNWAYCDGSTVSIRQNPPLYSVIGVQFGGDGQTTFKLPNLAGSAVCQAGQGTGLSSRTFGMTVGASAATLNYNQMPLHQHDMNVLQSPAAALDNKPNNKSYLARSFGQLDYTTTDIYDTTLAPQAVLLVGGGTAHENRQPYLVMSFCICLDGDYPVRT